LRIESAQVSGYHDDVMRVKVRFFALLRDRAGVAEHVMELKAGAKVEEAIREVGERFPAARDVLGRAAAAVNLEYVQGGHVLRDGDELALIPPVSGGC
jgi:MoaE-MoaD fusion protein